MFTINYFKKHHIMFIFFITALLPSCFSQTESFAFTELIMKNNKPTAPIYSLLQLSNIVDIPENLNELVATTQKNWLRRPNQERWHMEEIANNTERDKFLHCFEQLQLLQEIRPKNTHYTYALLLGATLHRTRTRLAYLIDLYNQGIRFDHLIVLGGLRPLDSNIETKENLLNPSLPNLPINKNWQASIQQLPTTESDMMRWVLEQTELPFDQEKIVFINTPMQAKIDGTLTRPTTADTIHEWLKKNPNAGSCLAISNQPFVGYQDTVIRTYLPSTFSLETVGEGIPEKERQTLNIAVILDSIARWIYQLNIYKKSI